MGKIEEKNKSFMLKLEGVVKQYSYGNRLFGAVDMTLEKGEILSILGLEGSGKTTFLKTVAGIEEYEGKITLDGEVIKGRTDDVIMVFDDGALFPMKTVFDNLAYPLKIRGANKVEIAEKVMQVADEFGLFATLKTRAKNLNLVEKRKVSLARILMRQAKLILIDDFLKDLPERDADVLFDEVTRVLYNLSKTNGTTVIFATESPRYALGFGDKTMVLVDGEIKQIGTYSDMWHNPTTVWSAKAVDDTYNTVKGTLKCENDRLTFVSTPLNGVFSLDENNQVQWKDADLYQTITLDVTERKDEIVEDFIGKDILIGWHGSDYDFDENGMKLDIQFVKNLGDKIVLQGDYDYEEIKVVTALQDKDKGKIAILPKVDKLHFFTVTENSILKRKHQ